MPQNITGAVAKFGKLLITGVDGSIVQVTGDGAGGAGGSGPTGPAGPAGPAGPTGPTGGNDGKPSALASGLLIASGPNGTQTLEAYGCLRDQQTARRTESRLHVYSLVQASNTLGRNRCSGSLNQGAKQYFLGLGTLVLDT